MNGKKEGGIGQRRGTERYKRTGRRRGTGRRGSARRYNSVRQHNSVKQYTSARRHGRAGLRKWFLLPVGAVGLCLLCAWFFSGRGEVQERPEELLPAYMEHIGREEYEEMYEMLNVEASGNISREDFIRRNSAIYEGIEVRNMRVEVADWDEEWNTLSYRTSFDTAAGEMSFENRAVFIEGESGYGLAWNDGLIFPGLEAADRVRVATTQAQRGEILDRNGRVLAGWGTASSVGVVPGKLEDRERAVEELAGLLGMEAEAIRKKLEEKWVKEDSFVPLKTVPRVEETELMREDVEGKTAGEKERQERLLDIPGVMISDVRVREYPLREAAAHLIGYIRGVTAEDLEEHAGEGYTAGSMIGRSGMEALFEEELRGCNGCRIYITDENGNEKRELANRPVQPGRNVKVTIDAGLQEALYENFREDKGCSVAMDPSTGEVLALVSTPSYDSNAFIRGLSSEEWAAWNENEDRPLYNRFRQAWCPGSICKSVTAAIGLESGAIDPAEDYGQEGKSWQKDGSWGAYHVTTLHTYDPVILENALIYSDNIYFAKAALKIGAGELEEALKKLGFGADIPFEITMAKSQFSNTEKIETEIQLADSGYGQGQILVNPLHMACIYSAFCNEGSMIKPYLLYEREAEPGYWIPSAFSPETADRIREALVKAVNEPDGTGYGARREDVLLAGKTGTAEIKASQTDTSGTELGWFAVFTARKDVPEPILIVSMVEDVKGRGGSGYVVEREKRVLEEWFGESPQN